MSEIKIGDVVAWDNVPNGALVRDEQGWYALRLRTRYGVHVDPKGGEWLCRWYRENITHARATIVALGLTGQETADDLRRLAEAFEVRS